MSRESSRNSHSASYVEEGAGDSDEETYVDEWLKSTATAAPVRAASHSPFLSSATPSRPQPQQSTHGKPTKQQPMLVREEAQDSSSEWGQVEHAASAGLSL